MFSNENDFRENDFFSVFGCIPKNAPENILQCCMKDKVEGVRHAFLENGLRKKIS
jgi:hypothetical protein